MTGGQISVAAGLAVIAVIAAIYFWPSSIGRGCPDLLLTAAQMRDGTRTGAEIHAAGQAGYQRNMCLMRQINARMKPLLPEQLSLLDELIKAIFVSDDVARFNEEFSASFDAWQASWPDDGDTTSSEIGR